MAESLYFLLGSITVLLDFFFLLHSTPLHPALPCSYPPHTPLAITLPARACICIPFIPSSFFLLPSFSIPCNYTCSIIYLFFIYPLTPYSMLHNAKKRLRPCWKLLSLALCLAAVVPIALAQPSTTTAPTQPTTSTSVVAPSSTTIASLTTPVATPTPPPAPAPLPPGTRELRDGQVVADKVAQGQLQTYHYSIVQGQSLPVKRQLERIIFHPSDNNNLQNLQKRQATPNPVTPTATTGAPTTTRTIAPTVPSPGPDGEYTVFISVSTCSTPKSGAALCPPLELYVSTSASQSLPGPGQAIQPVYSEDGLIRFTVKTKKDVFFSLRAPTLTGTWTGDWAVEVGASTQGTAHLMTRHRPRL